MLIEVLKIAVFEIILEDHYSKAFYSWFKTQKTRLKAENDENFLRSHMGIGPYIDTNGECNGLQRKLELMQCIAWWV